MTTKYIVLLAVLLAVVACRPTVCKECSAVPGYICVGRTCVPDPNYEV